MKLTVPVAVLGLVLLLGLAVGWSLHARQFSGRQRAWIDSVQVAHVRTDIALQAAAQAKAEADSLRAEAAGYAGDAARLVASQRQVALASRAAKDALTAARTTGDSLRAAIEVVVAVEAERDTALRAGDAWRSAYQREFAAANRLAVRGDSLERVVVRQDSLLQSGTKVVGSSGCRIPILGVRCPEVVVGYGGLADLSGGAVTLHRGVAVTAGWRIL